MPWATEGGRGWCRGNEICKKIIPFAVQAVVPLLPWPFGPHVAG